MQNRLKALALAVTYLAFPLFGKAQTVSSLRNLAEAPSQVAPFLPAEDINGFRIGMTYSQVSKLTSMTRIGRGDFRATVGTAEYDFGFTALGHLYRIDMRQSLGRFHVDDEFRSLLMRRLTAKFGPTSGWDFVVPVMDGDGRKLNRNAGSLSAYLEEGSGDGTVDLVMKLVDFRVLWLDEAAINQSPRDEAARSLVF